MYELTMVDAALRSGMADTPVVFEIFGRKLPPTRRFGVVAGTGRALEELDHFKFSPAQIDWLHSEKIVSDTALEFLREYRFGGTIHGYPEGECYFEGSPLLTVEGTFAECTLLETVLLSVLNYDCAVASAAARITMAAHGRPCADMGARRTNEHSAVAAARAAYIGGFASTSNLEAGMRYGIKTIGTSAHAFTLVHDSEEDAFRAQVASLGAGTTLLADTFDIPRAVELAVQVARESGSELGAIRLDSGDLLAHAFKVRGQLDALGAKDTKITVTNDLDEYAIAALGAAPVDSYGVGTKLVTGSGVPTAALVYKLVAKGKDGKMVPVAKESEAKSTVGGMKVAGRLFDEQGRASEEVLVVADSWEEGTRVLQEAGARPLQVPLVEQGKILEPLWDPQYTERARSHCLAVREELPYPGWRLSAGEPAIPTGYYRAGERIG